MKVNALLSSQHIAKWIFVGLVLLGLGTSRSAPWTDDARFYVPAAAAYGQWLIDAVVGIVTLDSSPFSQAALDQAFRHNSEHPPVGKLVMAISWLIFHRGLGWTDPILACRVGVILLWAWMGALVFALVRRHVGDGPGLFATATVVLMPRVFFHGRVETLDLPVAVFLVATSAAWLQHRDRPKIQTALAAICFFALALGSKLNAPFFLVGLALFGWLCSPPQCSHRGIQLRPLSAVSVGLVLLSPLLTWALWPWLWFDSAARFWSYVQYHLHHYGIFFYYRGALYGDPVAPWHAPLSLLLITVPVPVLLLAGLGGWRVARALMQRWQRHRTEPPTRRRVDAFATETTLGLFAATQLLAQLIAVSLPGVPKYGGIKLFVSAFPFLAILTAIGFARVWRELKTIDCRPRTRTALGWAVATIILLPGLLGVVGFHGRWLSYYNSWTGGLPGAVAAGFERQYYDLAYPEIPQTLARHLPEGGTFAVLPNPKEYGPYVNDWHRHHHLPATIQLVPPGRADLLILTHERRWRTYPELMARYRRYPLLDRMSVAGVPLLSVFDLRTPPTR